MKPLPLVAALVVGVAIAWVDTRPNWDDTGVTVGVILLSALVLGVAEPKRPWLQALALGAWIPLAEVPRGHGFAPLAALVIAFVGAYAGSFVGRLLFRGEDPRRG